MAKAPIDGLSPEEQALWQQQFGAFNVPQGAPVPAKPSDWNNYLAQGDKPAWLAKAAQARFPNAVDVPPPEPMAAQARPSGGGPAGADWMAAAMGKPQPTGSPTDATQVPLHGDWNKFAKDQKESEKANDKGRVDGATFYNQDGRYEQIDADPRGAQGGQMVKVSEGGRQPHSWTTQVTEGTHLPGEVLGAYDKADASQMDAIQKERELAEKKAAYNAQYADATERYQQGFQSNQAAMRQRQQVEMDRATTDLRALQDHAAGDPTSNYFRDKGEGSQIMAIVAGMLGGAAAGANGRNLGLESLNKNIDRYIENQRDTIKAKHNLLGELRTKFGDERMAEEAARISYYERAKAQLGRLSSDVEGDAAAVNAQKATAALDEKIAERGKVFAAASADKVARVQQDVNTPAQYAQVGGGAGGATEKERRKGFNAESHTLAEDYAKANLPQKIEALKTAERLIDIHGKESIPGVGIGSDWVPDRVLGYVDPDAAKNKQALSHLKNGIIHELSGAAVSPSEMERYRTELEGARDADGVRAFLRQVHAEVSAQQRNIRAGTQGDVVHGYLERGGPVRDVHPTRPVAPTVKRAE